MSTVSNEELPAKECEGKRRESEAESGELEGKLKVNVKCFGALWNFNARNEGRIREIVYRKW